MADAERGRSYAHINAIPGGTENVNDQMERLVARGLAAWRLKPSRSLNSVGRGHIRVTHGGQEALRLDTPTRRFTVWMLEGIPTLLWGITIAAVSAAAGAVVGAWVASAGFFS